MSEPGSPAGLPTLHHLNVCLLPNLSQHQQLISIQDSQCQRILWLLEELSIPYNLKLYSRNSKTKRAPPELAAPHPLGKSPILVTADGRSIVESSAVAAYLIKTYDKDGKFASEDWIRDEILTSFAGATMGPIATVELLFDLMAQNTPWPLSYIPRAVHGAIHKGFTGPEFKKSFEYLERELGDKKFFNGKQLGRCDVMISWPLDMLTERKYVNIEEYPKVAAWRKMIHERPAWKRGLEKGNGYDLTSW